MIWIIAGTSEGREIVERINDIDSFIATIATDGGREFIDSENVQVGRMNYDQMKQFAVKNNISLIVDMTHPYAKVVSKNAKDLASELHIRYIRYTRGNTEKSVNAIYLESYEDAYSYLSKIKGTVFFTTGSKNIVDFEKIKGDNRFIYRILPALDSIKICKDLEISMKDIVAVLGPFSFESNMLMFKEYKADYVVMKDSGIKGGTIEKIRACEETNITPIIISRHPENGIDSLDKIEKIIREETNKNSR